MPKLHKSTQTNRLGVNCAVTIVAETEELNDHVTQPLPIQKQFLTDHANCTHKLYQKGMGRKLCSQFRYDSFSKESIGEEQHLADEELLDHT